MTGTAAFFFTAAFLVEAWYDVKGSGFCQQRDY